MNKKLGGLAFATALAAMALSSTAVQASLIDLENGLIYDDVLNVSWLQNANLAATETFGVAGIGSGGVMNWYTAKAWIAAMNNANYLGFNTWRLPTVTPLDGVGFNYVANTNGTADRGFNVSAPGTLYAGSMANELAHLFHNSLGNMGWCAIADGTVGECISPTADNYWEWGLVNTGPFDNMVANRYATGVTSTIDPDRAFDFDFSHGQVGTGGKGGNLYAIAILDGNVSVVPVPAAVWLLGSGLLGLVAVGRKRRAV
ncbi:MAG: DUF1566 domain-containing protein [Bacteroidales bacterium]|nr:DUF1566 domain-containing protein [Bacteroidales bacterium]